MAIKDLSSSECPRSCSSGWITEVLLLFATSKRFEGAFLQGPNLWDWSAHLYDAFDLLNRESNMLQSTLIEADEDI